VSTPNDGGPAFPNDLVHDEGMSLRDYFASTAINDREWDMLRDAYFNAHPEGEKVSVAQLRYFRADQMLKTRKENGYGTSKAWLKKYEETT
jgi:hypothetical protein